MGLETISSSYVRDCELLSGAAKCGVDCMAVGACRKTSKSFFLNTRRLIVVLIAFIRKRKLDFHYFSGQNYISLLAGKYFSFKNSNLNY